MMRLLLLSQWGKSWLENVHGMTDLMPIVFSASPLTLSTSLKGIWTRVSVHVCVYLVAALIIPTHFPSLSLVSCLSDCAKQLILRHFSNSSVFSIGKIFKTVFLLSPF
jgi:hypothetical protein